MTEEKIFSNVHEIDQEDWKFHRLQGIVDDEPPRAQTICIDPRPNQYRIPKEKVEIYYIQSSLSTLQDTTKPKKTTMIISKKKGKSKIAREKNQITSLIN